MICKVLGEFDVSGVRYIYIYIYIYIFEIWLLDSYLDNRYNGNRSKCFKEKGSPRLFVV